jgi:hypothetical protein
VAAILEFVRSESAVFDPQTVQVLVSALDEAWARIEKTGCLLGALSHKAAIITMLGAFRPGLASNAPTTRWGSAARRQGAGQANACATLRR